eukprot:1136147-Pelagomonas_calceolata.AAC.4
MVKIVQPIRLELTSGAAGTLVAMADQPMDLETGSSASTSKLLSDREAERANERRQKYKE